MKKYLRWYRRTNFTGYVIGIRYTNEKDIEYLKTSDTGRYEFLPAWPSSNSSLRCLVYGAVKDHMKGKNTNAWVPVTEEEFVLWLLGDTNG